MLEPTFAKFIGPERIIYQEIIEEREPSHWTAHRCQIAALLAKQMRALAVAQQVLQSEGFVVSDPHGNLMMNPLVRVVDQGIRSICAYRRSLAIHARALGGEARDIARRRQIHLQQQRDAPRNTDGLIASPDNEGGDNDR